MTNSWLAKLKLADPEQTSHQIVAFLKERWLETGLKAAVIAVSGGIDSALSLTLLVKAIGKDKVFPILLPYEKQDMTDAWTAIEFNQLDRSHCRLINIQSSVMALADSLQIDRVEDKLRFGNLMARTRMIALYDWAKQQEALVVGTENKSEHHLGYFTLHGDAAADLEPLLDLYKTQVRQLAQFLKLPPVFLEKPPSAGLWSEQSDEAELGFSYQLADQILWALVDEKNSESAIKTELASSYELEQIEKVFKQVKKMAYKLKMPYRRELSK